MEIVSIFLLILIHLITAEGFRILGICPSASYSHQQPFQAVMKALANRGHQITVISPVPLKDPIKNYVDIDVSFTFRNKDCTKLRHINEFSILQMNMDDSNKLCEEQMMSTQVQKLMNSDISFDAIIIEQLWFQCYYALVKRYNFPLLIGFLSVGNLPYAMDSVGNPDNPLLNADMAFAFNDTMTIYERIWNVVYTLWSRMYFKFIHLPHAQRIATKIIPGTSVFEIDKNFSLVILGNNHIFGYPKPLLPNVIEVHSLHITESSTDLPQHIQQFLENATYGVIYFSLGSNLQSHQLPNNTITELYDAFRSLKQKVLWKYSGSRTFQSENIKLINWVPQQAVLAHKNTKIFIMQGGLQSLQEAVHYGVPLISIPFFGDQKFNTRKILESKIGLSLLVDEMTKETIVNVVKDILENPIYAANVRKMSAMVQDEIIRPMEKTVWNIEHLLKFPKASHFCYQGRHITWLDNYGTVIIIICISVLIFAFTTLLSLKIYDCFHVIRLSKTIIEKKRL